MNNPTPYILVYSHDPQFRWLNLVAKAFRRQFGFQAILMVNTHANAEAARGIDGFDEVVNAASDTGEMAFDEDDAIAILQKIEKSSNQIFVNSSITMDRHEIKRDRPYGETLRSLATVAAVIGNIIATRGRPQVLICEPNLAPYRLAHMMLSDIPSFYIYQLTQMDNRIYFDYSLG